MASNTIELSSDKAWEGVIYWESTRNIAGNYSDVYVYAGMWKTDGYLTSSNSYTSGTITINGTSYNLTGYQQFKDEVCIFEDTIRVYHNSDGSKTINISLTCYGQANTSLSGYTLSGSGQAVLDTIPRSSTLTASNGVLGTEMQLGITSQSSGFTHTITYKCGNATGTICQKTSQTTVRWTPPESLAAQSTTSSTISVTLTLTAYSGNTVIGTDTVSIQCSVPSGVAPSLSVSLSDNGGYFGKYGAYVQSKSTIQVKITASGIYGSTITACKVSFDDRTYTGAQIVTEEIRGSGNMTLVATVTDSRGKSASRNVAVNVLPYSAPTVSNLVAQRCDDDGTPNARGEYLAVIFDASITPLNNKNSAAYTLKYKKRNDSVYTSVDLSELAGKYVVSQYQYIFAAARDSSYNVVIHIEDDFPGVDKGTVGSSETTLWSYFTNGMGYAIGKIAERLGYLDIGFHIHMNGNMLHGLPEPEEDDHAATKSYADAIRADICPTVYPVGSVYISTNSTSPASLFGGSWEQLQGKFLLGAGDGYTAGNTGGEATHTLTEDEIPEHNHWGAARFDYNVISGTHPSAASNGTNNNLPQTNNAGGGQAHNNMPPYVVVYIWKRVS